MELTWQIAAIWIGTALLVRLSPCTMLVVE